ncbi:hypothetical protein FXV77_05155 [Sphingobacterium phlebotomi]|uniref:Uncharacterized protein n=1 Tax=Sphingobacterium phlebotomi TaxID=2605433 RepID=A0A5D4H954_9SPHI|nr:hypothetical protein [Sphingobacterium phlebotomi]TYR37396.1 hypothetical protein FXV77_05155 [Sphingobacterium phlebotomi]
MQGNEIKRRVVMIDPRKTLNKLLYAGEIARVEFISNCSKEIAIVHFDERGIYNAYNIKDLLVIYPERLLFENICKNFGKLDDNDMREIFAVVTNYQKRYYEDSFRIGLKNKQIAPLCITDLGSILRPAELLSL